MVASDGRQKAENAALKAELKANKRGKETSGGKASDSAYNPASFSAPNKDEHVKRIQKRYPSLEGNTEYQQILNKYGGFYRTCVNCGRTDLKQLPCVGAVRKEGNRMILKCATCAKRLRSIVNSKVPH